MKRIVALILALSFAAPAIAHDHKPGETSEQKRVVDFLSSWRRPKGSFSITHRQQVCCYSTGANQDCFPVKAVRRADDGVIEVLPDTDGTSTTAQANYTRWYRLDTGVEEDKQPDPRNSPDGRSYVCLAGNVVICYVAGAGT